MATLGVICLSIVAALMAAPSAGALSGSSRSLELRLSDGKVAWDPVDGATEYRVYNGVSGHTVTTTATELPAEEFTYGEDLSAGAVALNGNQVIAHGYLRGGIDTIRSKAKDQRKLSVQQGMSILSSMEVSVAGTNVRFTMPADLIPVIASWQLYRGDVLVGETRGAVLSDTDLELGGSYSYTVVLSAPDWLSGRDSDITFIPAVNECEIGPAECHDTQSEAHPEDFEHDAEDDLLHGDGLTFTMPVDIPGESASTADSGGFQTAGHVPGTNTTADDAYVWHNTFIEQAKVNAPQPPGYPDYWFGGDNRGFASGPGAATRTVTRIRVDWVGRHVYYSRSASPTTRYIRNANGTFTFDGTKSTTNNSLVELRNESGRYRVRVRHSVGNPFEFYFPNIDYEWEYIMVSDGGITARGLHDGAPNYEIFYEHPYQSTRNRVYIDRYTSFSRLAPPMDKKDRGWCYPSASGGGGCPGYGTPVWVP